MQTYRYPGSTPFEDNDYDRLLFFGREREKLSLFHLVMSERLSVLFAKSGIGKTSLIHAGVNQLFREKELIPLVIRFHAVYADPFQAVYKTIEDIAKRQKTEYIPGKQDSLWEYFKTVEFWTSDDVLLSPVLIFDQFEDFFALYSPEKRKVFIRELADLVRNRIPAKLCQGETAFPYSETPPDVKILIAVREDYLGLLEEMADDIPHIFQNRFRLMPLNREQAKEAIINPAALKDERIHSPAFKYEDEALEAILEYLGKRKERDGIKIVNEIESFQLQLICRHIENGISEQSDKQHEPIITKQDVSGLPDVLQKFYEKQLNPLGKRDKKNITRLCEEGLISVTDRRLSLEQEEIKRKFKVSKLVLEKLVNSRLLRAESRVGSVYYELSHDTLIEPVRNVEKKLQKKLQKMAKYSVIGTVILSDILLFVLIIFSLFFYYNKLYYKAYGDALLVLGQYNAQTNHGLGNGAISMYKKAIEVNPKDAYAYNGLGNAYSDMELYDEAIAAFNKAIELDPKFAYAYNGLGNAYSDMELYDEAIAAYSKAIELDPKYATAYKNLGATYRDMKRYDEAIAAFNKAIELDPKYATIYYNLGRLYSDDMKRYDEAIAAFNKAIELDPKYAYPYSGLGNTYSDMKRYDEAIAAYNKAIELDPKFAYPYNGLGATYRDMKRYDEAIAAFNKAIELNPKYVAAYKGLGNVYLYLKRYDEAIAAYNKAIELDPNYVYPKGNMAEVFIIKGDTGKALSLLHEVLKEKDISPYNMLGNQFNMVCALLIENRRIEAIDELKRLIQYHQSLSEDYERRWRYVEMKDFIFEHQTLPKSDKDLVLKLADALESPKPEADRKMKEIEAGIGG